MFMGFLTDLIVFAAGVGTGYLVFTRSGQSLLGAGKYVTVTEAQKAANYLRQKAENLQVQG